MENLNINNKQTFTCFGQLPKEIRERIWDLAIQNRNAEPEAHFFSISYEKQKLLWDTKQDRTSLVWSESTTLVTAPTWKTCLGVHRSWDSLENPSAYLLDSGLWNACIESRDVVAARWDRIHRCDSECRYTCARYDRYQVTTLIIGEGASRRWLTVRPQLDLIVYQLPYLDTTEDPVFTPASGLFHWGSIRTENLAIEYNPRWMWEIECFERGCDADLGQRLRERMNCVGGLLREALKISVEMYGGFLWLVDHTSLQPADRIKYSELAANHKVFFSRGRRYIQVFPSDVGKR